MRELKGKEVSLCDGRLLYRQQKIIRVNEVGEENYQMYFTVVKG